MGGDGNLEQVVAMEVVRRSLILYQFCSVASEFAKGFEVRERWQKIKDDSEVLGGALRWGGGWRVRLSHAEIPGRGGCKTQTGVGQEKNGGEKLMTMSKDNPSEKFCCKQGERDASWGKSGVKKGFLFKWKKLKRISMLTAKIQ